MKIFSGIVVSKKMEKTAVVEVSRMMAHPVYRKRLKKTKKYLVHDELGVEVGNKVNFVACKPMSKMKKWKIVERKKSKESPSKTVTKGSKKGGKK